MIAAGLVVSLWFWHAADTAATNEGIAREEAVASAKEAKEKEQLAVEQTNVAQRELARAVEIKRLITEMLQSVTPEQAKGADITLLKGILDTASKRLEEGAIEDEGNRTFKQRLRPPEPRHSTIPPRGHPVNPPASQPVTSAFRP